MNCIHLNPFISNPDVLTHCLCQTARKSPETLAYIRGPFCICNELRSPGHLCCIRVVALILCGSEHSDAEATPNPREQRCPPTERFTRFRSSQGVAGDGGVAAQPVPLLQQWEWHTTCTDRAERARGASRKHLMSNRLSCLEMVRLTAMADIWWPLSLGARMMICTAIFSHNTGPCLACVALFVAWSSSWRAITSGSSSYLLRHFRADAMLSPPPAPCGWHLWLFQCVCHVQHVSAWNAKTPHPTKYSDDKQLARPRCSSWVTDRAASVMWALASRSRRDFHFRVGAVGGCCFEKTNQTYLERSISTTRTCSQFSERSRATTRIQHLCGELLAAPTLQGNHVVLNESAAVLVVRFTNQNQTHS